MKFYQSCEQVVLNTEEMMTIIKAKEIFEEMQQGSSSEELVKLAEEVLDNLEILLEEEEYFEVTCVDTKENKVTITLF